MHFAMPGSCGLSLGALRRYSDSVARNADAAFYDVAFYVVGPGKSDRSVPACGNGTA